MADGDDSKPSNEHLDVPEDDRGSAGETGGASDGGNRPAGGDRAAHPGAVGQHPDEMRERGTVDPDKPDPSGGPPG